MYKRQLLQYAGDQGYLKADPSSSLSDDLQVNGLKPFPEGYCIKKVREEIQNDLNNERLYGAKPGLVNCTNAVSYTHLILRKMKRKQIILQKL